MKRRVMFIIILLTNACAKAEESTYQPTYSSKPPALAGGVAGIHLLHNPKKLMAVYGPIMDYMDTTIPEARFEPAADKIYRPVRDFPEKLSKTVSRIEY